jgi:hypothetical protein
MHEGAARIGRDDVERVFGDELHCGDDVVGGRGRSEDIGDWLA